MDFSQCKTVSTVPTRKKKKHALLNYPIFIDTETSKHIEKDANGKVTVAYGWVYLYGLEFAGLFKTGRTPTELIKDLEEIRDHYGCSAEGTHIVVYIHNLSYDIQYLKDFLIKRYGGVYDMLAIATHKFITFSCDAFEFRCSFKLSNRSLAKWAKDLGVQSQKAVGEIDYTETHYQTEPLEENQYHYLKMDVLTLRDCVLEQMRLYGDNVQTIPLTSTGYVRRVTRKNFRKTKGNVEKFRKTQLSLQAFTFCWREFSGGMTHGNRFHAGEIVKGKIRHADFDSHYPTQQRARVFGFPASRFMLLYDENDKKRGEVWTIKKLLSYAHDNCVLVEIALRNIKIKEGVTLPYAQASKFIEGKQRDWKRPITDNGRILQSFGTSVVVYNEIDLTILNEDYTFDYEILTIFSAKRGAVPQYIGETVDYFYSEKTRLKNEVKRLKKENASEDVIREAEKSLLIVKQMLNGIYGMTATLPCRCNYSMNTLGEWSEEVLTPELMKEKLHQYYGNFNSFNPYQVGIYTTSLARYQLWYVIKHIIGYENFLYCDTDSCFYISTEENERKLAEYNKRINAAAIKNGAYITLPDGTRKVYDNFADEGEDITEFVFLHAKAYCYKCGEKMRLVVAGVPDITNGVTREQELGTIENFKSGFTFRINGGTRAIYTEGLPHTITENGYKIELASACLIENSEKTLHDEISTEGFLYVDDGERFDLL